MMTKSSFYPKANRTAQWWEKDFARGYFTKIEKILLHTTETSTWPNYQNGAVAPTLTYKVTTREWRQHNYLDTSARALGDPATTPVRENRDNVIQIEIIWYAKDAGKLPDTAYNDLAEFIAYVRKEWGGPNLVGAKFVDEAGAPKVHMSSASYDTFNGILGHQHVPSPSTHWDPGAIDVAKLINLVKKIEAPVIPPVTPPPPTPSKPSWGGDASVSNPTTYAIWYWDGLYSPSGETDKFWTPQQYLAEIYKQNEEILALLRAQQK